MGLFSTLASGGVEASSSSRIPTVVQLYTDSSDPIKLDASTAVSGFTAMTYQAVQVSSLLNDEEQKNKHYKPDLGVWNCRVTKPVAETSAAAVEGEPPSEPAPPLVDQLLRKVVSSKNAHTYVFTVDLTDEDRVEPAMSLLQGALIRHLIENPPSAETERKTATTSLHTLKRAQFGLAPQDPKRSQEFTSNESEEQNDKAIKTSLMICAMLPSSTGDVQAETAYRTKQARALVLYHLRKYAVALDASLCFVTPNEPTPASADSPEAPEEQAPQEQPSMPVEKLAQLWRDLALDEEGWMKDTTAVATVASDGEEADADVVATALYGPGRQQEDLIESALLRNAHCPGHWDAAKDSLWIALPTSSDDAEKELPDSTGDESWLSQLRESLPTSEVAKDAASPEKKSTEEKPKEKDVAVSSFFENLLKN